MLGCRCPVGCLLTTLNVNGQCSSLQWGTECTVRWSVPKLATATSNPSNPDPRLPVTQGCSCIPNHAVLKGRRIRMDQRTSRSYLCQELNGLFLFILKDGNTIGKLGMSPRTRMGFPRPLSHFTLIRGRENGLRSKPLRLRSSILFL